MNETPIQDAIRLLCSRGCAVVLPDSVTIKTFKNGAVTTATATHEINIVVDDCGFASVRRGREVMP